MPSIYDSLPYIGKKDPFGVLRFCGFEIERPDYDTINKAYRIQIADLIGLVFGVSGDSFISFCNRANCQYFFTPNNPEERKRYPLLGASFFYDDPCGELLFHHTVKLFCDDPCEENLFLLKNTDLYYDPEGMNIVRHEDELREFFEFAKETVLNDLYMMVDSKVSLTLYDKKEGKVESDKLKQPLYKIIEDNALGFIKKDIFETLEEWNYKIPKEILFETSATLLQEEPLISKRKIAEYIGKKHMGGSCSVSSIKKWMKAPRCPLPHKINANRRVSAYPSEIDRWWKRRKKNR